MSKKKTEIFPTWNGENYPRSYKFNRPFSNDLSDFDIIGVVVPEIILEKRTPEKIEKYHLPAFFLVWLGGGIMEMAGAKYNEKIEKKGLNKKRVPEWAIDVSYEQYEDNEYENFDVEELEEEPRTFIKENNVVERVISNRWLREKTRVQKEPKEDPKIRKQRQQRERTEQRNTNKVGQGLPAR